MAHPYLRALRARLLPVESAVRQGLATVRCCLAVWTVILGSGIQAFAGSQPAVPSRPTMRVLLGGDLYLGESYVGLRGSKLSPAANGQMASIAGLLGLFAQADAVVVNLEASLAREQTLPYNANKAYLHRGHAQTTIAALQALHVTAVGLANNHSMDYGENGLADTMAALRQQRIGSFGAGENQHHAAQPWTARFRGERGVIELVVVAGYKYARAYETTHDAYAGRNDQGVNCWTPETATRQLQELRRTSPAAFIVAFPHGGENYRWRDRQQAELHQALITAGADLVVGHGSHMAQEIECLQGHWVLHGLGNAVLNSPGRYRDYGQHPWSLIAALHADPEGSGFRLSLRLYPILSDNQLTHYRPRLATHSEAVALGDLLLAGSGEGNHTPRLVPTEDAWGWHYPIDLGPRPAAAVTSQDALAAEPRR